MECFFGHHNKNGGGWSDDTLGRSLALRSSHLSWISDTINGPLSLPIAILVYRTGSKPWALTQFDVCLTPRPKIDRGDHKYLHLFSLQRIGKESLH